MPFCMLWEKLPEVAEKETRTITVLKSHDGLPAGTYLFLEMFCNEKGCDCRRVFFQVMLDEKPVAVIAWGWESAAFYKKWMHGGTSKDIKMLQGPILNLGSPETALSTVVLDLFKQILLPDPVYTDRVKRHYKLFRDKVESMPDEMKHPFPSGKPDGWNNENQDAEESDIDRILGALEDGGDFPYDAVEEVIRRKEEMTPHLLVAISDATEQARDGEADPDDLLLQFAMHLLAQFRETRAYPLIVNLCKLPAETVDDLLGDTVAEGLPRILASVCGGDIGPLKALVEDASVNEYARAAALYALTILFHEGSLSRADHVAYYRDLFHGKLEKEHSHVWDELVAEAIDLYMKDLESDIRAAYQDGLASPFYTNPKSLDKTFAKREAVVLAKSKRNCPGLIDDAIGEMEEWCFSESDDDEVDRGDWDVPALASTTFGLPLPAGPVIARNAPCPCGSGKKYKKCCGSGDKAAGQYEV